MHLKSIFLLCVALSLGINAGKSRYINFKSFICPRDERDLGKCLRDKLNAYIPRLAKGVPEYGVPSCEPLLIPEVNLKQDLGAVSVASRFSDLIVRGPSTIKITNLEVDRANETVTAQLFIPLLRIKGRYEIVGSVLSLPIQGDGICTGNYSNVEASVVLLLGRTPRPSGVDALACEDLRVDVEVHDADVRLENLFGGDDKFGGVMNKFIKENWSRVSDELRPALETSLRDFLKPLADHALSTLDAADILE